MKGKEICKILRQIRQQVATENNIPYVTEECQHKGDCPGTCPKCDSEVSYLNAEIQKRGISVQKMLAVAGLSLALSSCDSISPISKGHDTRGRIPMQGDVAMYQQTTIDTSGQTSSSNRVPRVVCRYTNYGAMEGDVPYEPEPTSGTIANRLMELIAYPDSMREAGIEAKVTLSFTYGKKAIAQDIEVKDSPNQAFIDAVTEALKKIDGEYSDLVEFEKQDYVIPIEFTLVQQ